MSFHCSSYSVCLNSCAFPGLVLLSLCPFSLLCFSFCLNVWCFLITILLKFFSLLLLFTAGLLLHCKAFIAQLAMQAIWASFSCNCHFKICTSSAAWDSFSCSSFISISTLACGSPSCCCFSVASFSVMGPVDHYLSTTHSSTPPFFAKGIALDWRVRAIRQSSSTWSYYVVNPFCMCEL